MTGNELARAVEERFGYSLHDSGLQEQLGSYRELWPKQDPAKTVAVFLKENVHWKAEFQPGEAPFTGEQPLFVAARHFSGLFAFRFGYSFGNMGKDAGRVVWLADVSGGSAPLVYAESARHIVNSPVLSSPVDVGRAQALFREVRDSIEDDPQRSRALAGEFEELYPRVIQLMPDWFAKHGIRGREQVPQSDAPSRSIATYRAFVPVVEILGARASGERRILAADEAEAAKSVATDRSYPPHILLMLLTHAVSGSAVAKEIASAANDADTPLLQYWSRKVLNGQPPFNS